MDDKQIIELYFDRNEQAIKETDVKYGAFCHRIAMNILDIHEDAEECVNDTYYSVWYSRFILGVLQETCLSAVFVHCGQRRDIAVWKSCCLS